MSVVDGCGGDQCAETPIAPNEMAAIQTDVHFIGVLNAAQKIAERAAATLRSATSRAPHETTGVPQMSRSPRHMTLIVARCRHG